MAVASAMLARQSSHKSGQSEQNEVVRVGGVCEKTHSWILWLCGRTTTIQAR